MPRKLPRAVLVFRVSALFVTLLTAFVALAVLAQVTSAGHASGKSGVVSAMARNGSIRCRHCLAAPPLLPRPPHTRRTLASSQRAWEISFFGRQ